MVKLKSWIWAIGIGVFFLSGCGSSGSSHSTEPRPALNEDNIVSSVVEEVKLDNKVVEGVAVDDIVVVVESPKDGKVIETVIPAETEFRYENGELVEAPPVVKIVQKESVAENAKDGKVEIKDVSKVEIKIEDPNGKIVIPSKPVEVKLKAPKNAKPGSRVRVDVPDGALIKNKIESIKNKLMVVVVGDDGYIHLTIVPETFKRLKVVVIIVEAVIEKPITGGAGGN